MKQILISAALCGMSAAAFSQEDSIKTRHDKLYYPITTIEKPMEMIETSPEKENVVPVVDPGSLPVKKEKAAQKKSASVKKDN